MSEKEKKHRPNIAVPDNLNSYLGIVRDPTLREAGLATARSTWMDFYQSINLPAKDLVAKQTQIHAEVISAYEASREACSHGEGPEHCQAMKIKERNLAHILHAADGIRQTNEQTTIAQELKPTNELSTQNVVFFGGIGDKIS